MCLVWKGSVMIELTLEAYLDEKVQSKHPFMVSVVGAGGKTSTMNFMKDRYGKARKLLYTTTTATLMPEDAAGVIWMGEQTEMRPCEFPSDQLYVCVFKNSVSERKVKGISAEICDDFYERFGAELILVEADGAKMKSMKAYASYEPVIPSQTDLVIVILGLSSFEREITDRTVHRTEALEKLIGKGIGDYLAYEDIPRLFKGENGFLKGVPETAKVCVMLNQSDVVASSKRRELENVAEALMEDGDVEAVFINSFRGGWCTGYKKSDGVALQGIGVSEPHMAHDALKVGGVVLAAGLSKRMGDNKLLLPFEAGTVLESVFRRALACGLDKLVTVCGRDADVTSKLSGAIGIPYVVNPDYALGQSTSMKCGLSAVREAVDACVFFMGDQPLIETSVIADMIEIFRERRDRHLILVPCFEGKRGTPVIFGSYWFDQLMAVEGDKGGRDIIRQATDSVETFEVGNPSFFWDVDNQASYERARRTLMAEVKGDK